MNIILENYLLIIIVGLFFVFALIGYLIDMLRNNKKDIGTIEFEENIVPEIVSETKKEENDDADDLLKNYDETKS